MALNLKCPSSLIRITDKDKKHNKNIETSLLIYMTLIVFMCCRNVLKQIIDWSVADIVFYKEMIHEYLLSITSNTCSVTILGLMSFLK